MTEKLLTGTLSLNTNKQTAILLLYTGSYKNTWAAQFVLFAKMHTEWNGCDWKFRHDRNCSTVRHHEACQVMPNSYPEWRNFQFVPNNNYGFFFLRTLPSTTGFKLEYAKIYHFAVKNCSVPLSDVDGETFSGKWRKNWRQKDVLTSCTRVVLHPRF